jgi:hypothetical protein
MRRRSWTAESWNLPTSPRWIVTGLIAIAVASVVAETAFAAPPQATIGTPFNTTSGSFFGQTGVGFGFGIPTSMPNGGSGVVGLNPQGGFAPNIMFQNGGQPAIPFGLGPTTPGASFGYAVKTPLGTAFFNLTASQGSDGGLMSGSSSITVMDGGTGFFSDTSQSPFVTGVVPVVGDGGSSVLGERLQRLANGEGATTQAELPHDAKPARAAADKPPVLEGHPATQGTDALSRRLTAAGESSAGQPVASLAEIRAQQAAEDQAANEEYHQKIQMAEAALAGGKPGVAKIYYQQVVRHANGALKQQAIDALNTLNAKTARPDGNSGETGSAR